MYFCGGEFNAQSIKNTGANADFLAHFGRLNITDSLVNANNAKYTMATSPWGEKHPYPIVNVTGDVINDGLEFAIKGGNFVHKYNGNGIDTIRANNAIVLSEYGSFVIDTNKKTALYGAGGIVLDSCHQFMRNSGASKYRMTDRGVHQANLAAPLQFNV